MDATLFFATTLQGINTKLLLSNAAIASSLISRQGYQGEGMKNLTVVTNAPLEATRSVPRPGYKTTKPLISAIKTMRRDLGAQDACIQLQELCITYMENSATATRIPIHDFLRLLYKGNDIPHGTYSFEELRQISAKSYLIVTYALFEKMLEEVIAYVRNKDPVLAQNWKEKNSSGGRLPPLLQLSINLPTNERSVLERAPEFRLLDYYRAARVANSHVKGSTAAKVKSAFSAMTTNDLAHFSSCYQLQAPNPPDAISFQDFRLFTRAIKYFSELINEVCA